MAKGTAKRNWQRNTARMRAFAMITLVINAIYLLVILIRNQGLPRFGDLLAIAFWAGQEYCCYRVLYNFALPTLGAQGELLDCSDVSDPQELGYLSFVQDTLWVCWVVQSLCVFHRAFAVFYLPVPATLLYKGWTLVLGPFLSNRLGNGGDNGTENGQGKGGHPARNRQERRREEREQRKQKKSGGQP